MTLRVAEVFGPTAQGEGPHVGHVSAFVRLSGCNLSCAWCDTPYTWDWTRYDESAESTVEDAGALADKACAMSVERVILTGGEPLVQQRHLAPFLARCAHWRVPVDVETNGTIAPLAEVRELVDTFVVSPKVMPSAEQLPEKTSRTAALAVFAQLAREGKAVFKYVARDLADLNAVCGHVVEHELSPVYVMPEGRSAAAILTATRTIADEVIAHGWRLSTRLHVLAWGDERGR
jgi:7-carboxy-7-deazaguanine synthase